MSQQQQQPQKQQQQTNPYYYNNQQQQQQQQQQPQIMMPAGAPQSYSVPPWMQQTPSASPWGGQMQQQHRLQFMASVSPESDPPVATSSLNRKTAVKLQQDLAKWARDAKDLLTREDLSTFSRAARNTFGGMIGGTLLARAVLPHTFPALAGGPKFRVWATCLLFVGYPVGTACFYFSQVPAMKKVLELRSPLGVQARYLFRKAEAEKSGMPPPRAPFPEKPPNFGMANQYGVPYGGGQLQGSQPFPWSSPNPQVEQLQNYQDQQQPSNSDAQMNSWNQQQPQQPPSVERNEFQGYRSWDDIRRSNSTTAAAAANATSSLVSVAAASAAAEFQ